MYSRSTDIRKASTTPLNFTRSINLALSERGIYSIKHAGGDELLETVLGLAIPMHARMIHGRDAAGHLTQDSQDYDAYGRVSMCTYSIMFDADRLEVNQGS